MFKTYIRNKFRVRNLRTNQIERLNTILNVKNVYQMVTGFETYAEAEQALKLYMPNPEYRQFYRVESYGDSTRYELPIPSEQAAKVLESRKYFSGKGLQYNTDIRRSDEQKYSSGKFYTREIWLAQSVERAKGLTVNKGKVKRERFNATNVFNTLQGQSNDGTLSLKGCIVDSIRKKLKAGELTDRKSIKTFLRERGYTSRNTNRIIGQVFNPTL
jgi:hypothetical protein